MSPLCTQVLTTMNYNSFSLGCGTSAVWFEEGKSWRGEQREDATTVKEKRSEDLSWKIKDEFLFKKL